MAEHDHKHDHEVNPAQTEMASLLAVQKIMQAEFIINPRTKVEKALGFLQEKEAELKKLGHEPSTEFNLFITELSKAYINGEKPTPAQAVNGVILRVDQALLPENAKRLVSKDPALATGEEKAKLLATADANTKLIQALKSTHDHAKGEKCGDEICTDSMAATAIMKPSDKAAVNKFATERQQ